MKWMIHFYDNDTVALECSDAGTITDIRLNLWVSNYPYADGTLTLDGSRISPSGKLSAIHAFGGVPVEFPSLQEHLPSRIRVTDRRSRRKRREALPRTLSREKALALLQNKENPCKRFITDPRVLFLCYAVVLDRHAGLFQAVMAAPPTRSAARKLLTDLGLLRKSLYPDPIPDESFYDKLTRFVDRIITDRLPELEQILAAVRDRRPVAKPELIKVAGVFALPESAAVLHRLTERTPVSLQREPENPYDPNAVRLYAGIDGTDRIPIGYLPKELAKKLAPKLDWGTPIAAQVEAVSPKEKLILISLGGTKDPHPTNRLTLTWGGFPDRRHTAILSAKTRELVYRYRHDAVFSEETEFRLRFTPSAWKHIAEPLIRTCNFPSWEPAYRGSGIEYKELLWKMTAASPHKITESCGCNAAPVQFSHFLAFIRACLDLNHSKAFGEITLTSEPAPEA